jgi:hypothetical protein
MRLLEGEIPPLENEDWFLSSSYLKGTPHHYKMKICFYMFLSSALLQNEIGFSHVAFRRATSLATK